MPFWCCGSPERMADLNRRNIESKSTDDPISHSDKYFSHLSHLTGKDACMRTTANAVQSVPIDVCMYVRTLVRTYTYVRMYVGMYVRR